MPLSDIRSAREKFIAALLAPWCWSVTLLWSLPLAALIIVTPGLARRRNLARWSARVLLRLLGLRAQVHGAQRQPAGACVVVANHASYLDGIILTALLPPRFAFVIKKEMAAVPIAGLLLRRLDSLFVENRKRADRGDTRRLLEHTAAGDALGIFPEGTFKRKTGLLPFRSGAFVTAARAQVPVLPITIRGSRRALPAKSLAPLPGTLFVQIHPAIYPRGGGREERASLQAEARAAILRDLDEPDLMDGSGRPQT
ncbi:lysophospholipid acyltransferase family protein [Natronospira bacteriovora]|uniref:Lysophospholipid acyltransferase family protein n=1 Tax=Natronospira bacteriovora TaxID=3069753 RepID=A0ABU0W904_9GAMM|nr:lysophospholipid acyltransferase family protein [Natronospira sp. AB-CW4]MDQ2069465.1 lysophospholipid acyltransferase family protein [Natronospira sp. AB-CW4]